MDRLPKISKAAYTEKERSGQWDWLVDYHRERQRIYSNRAQRWGRASIVLAVLSIALFAASFILRAMGH